MRSTSVFPYVQIRCPYTGDRFVVREGKARIDGNGDVTAPAHWLYDGQKYNNLDDILDVRKQAAEGKVTKGTGKPAKKRSR